MGGDALDVTETRARMSSPASGPRSWVLPMVLALLLGVALALLVGVYLGTRPPNDDSAVAGFTRDMAIHHTQAVEMALIARDRTDDDQIRILATDILLTQQNQIGQFEGWLNVWGVSLTGGEPPMAWMGHEVQGRMPGMASQEEVEQLRALPVDQMNVQFLRLMIVHHVAGVDMAQAIIDRTDRPEVLRIAEAIVKTQQNESALMEQILDRLGATGPDAVATPAASPSPSHDHVPT